MILRLASWNVLATGYCVPARYPHCAPGWDQPERRAQSVAAIVARLAGECDAVCLQEVDAPLVAAIRAAVPDAVTCLAAHRGRRDAVMVLTVGSASSPAESSAGRMSAAGIVVEKGGRRVGVLSTHLEWSADGMTGRKQLDTLLGVVGKMPADSVALGMDANADGESIVCEPLRSRGWALSPPVQTALVHGRGWVPLDVVAVDRGRVSLVDVMAPDSTIPSHDWPSDHLALVAELTL